MKSKQTTIEPGFYQINMGGASLGECWRFGKSPIRFINALLWKLSHKKLDTYTWLPSSDSLLYCDFHQLQTRAQENLKPIVEKVHRLGFQEGQFLHIDKYYQNGYSENGGYVALHQDHKRALIVSFAYSSIEIQNVSHPIVTSKTSYVVWFYDSIDQQPVGVHNNDLYWDGTGRSKIYLMKTNDIEKVIKKSEEVFQKYNKPIRSFRDIPDYHNFLWPIEDEGWLSRIHRGLFVKVPVEIEEKLKTWK